MCVPCRATITLAMQSGTLVPAARKVMPMMTSGMPRVKPITVTWNQTGLISEHCHLYKIQEHLKANQDHWNKFISEITFYRYNKCLMFPLCTKCYIIIIKTIPSIINILFNITLFVIPSPIA